MTCAELHGESVVEVGIEPVSGYKLHCPVLLRDLELISINVSSFLLLTPPLKKI